MGNGLPQRNRRVSVEPPKSTSTGSGSKNSLTLSNSSSGSPVVTPRSNTLDSPTSQRSISNHHHHHGSLKKKQPQAKQNNIAGYSFNFPYTADDVTAMNQPPFAFRAFSMSPTDHTMVVNVSELRRLLTRPDVRDKPVIVISVAGLMRRGKSFLLNFMVRYLETFNYQSNGRPFLLPKMKKWLKSESSVIPLLPKIIKPHCPKWQKRRVQETVVDEGTMAATSANSIYIWSRPYFRHIPGVGEVVIILLEAQTSTFECPSTAKDCAKIIAMSTMLSSIQVFNVQGGLDESDLQHLQMFAEYGRNVLSDLRTKPFQNLVFLVRDWSRPYEFPYGFEGGERYLADLRGIFNYVGNKKGDSPLSLSPTHRHLDLERIWQKIDEYFESFSCFLMPHPGTAVATSEKFDGQLKQIDAAFLEGMREFVPKLLSDGNLELKTINSNPVTCAGLFTFMKKYAETLQSNSLPAIPDSLTSSAAHLHYWSRFDAAKTNYEEEMEKIVESFSLVTIEQLATEHERVLADATKLLLHDKTLVSDEHVQEMYAHRLVQFTVKRFEHYAKLVEIKNETIRRSKNGHLPSGINCNNNAHPSTLANSLKVATSQTAAGVQQRRVLRRRLINAVTYGAMFCLLLAVIAVIGLPVLVSVLVAGALFYFSKQMTS